jgi:hypothetical protein
VVSGIYTNAHTTLLTAHGPTTPVPVNRGTLQGDTPSPVLFLLYIEPLLRWLHSGGRGYQYGCMTQTENQ